MSSSRKTSNASQEFLLLNKVHFVIVIERWRLSSAGERFLHTEEVVGSIPTVSTINAVLAQLAEQLICNHQVVGSIPIDGTRSINKYTGNGIFFIFLT